MNTLVNDFHEGGMAMFLIAFLGGVGLVGGVAGFVLGVTVARRRTLLLAVAMMALGGLAPAAGGLGYTLGMSQVNAALAMVNPDDAEIIRTAGTAEALTNVEYGLGAGLLPICLGLALLGLGMVRLYPPPPR